MSDRLSAAPDRPSDRFLQRLARIAAQTFYRRIEVRGRARMPGDGPLIVVANHGNSLVDPMLVFAKLPRRSLFLAKSTLWQHAVAKYIVRNGPAIPVYRRHDPGVDTSQNEATFERSHRALDAGKIIALFPEGLSHGEPQLQPLKTGAARILLEAERRFGPLGTRVVPVGLTFESRDRFRSCALVEIGEPLDPAAEQADYADDPRGAVRALTTRIDEALRSVTLNYENWREAELLERAAEIYLQPQPEVPRRLPLGHRFNTRKALLAAYRRLRERLPDQVAEVAEATDAYDRLLRARGVSDAQVASSYPPQRVLRFLWRSLATLTLWLPLAIIGYLLNWIPYRVPGLFTKLLRRPLVEQATYKVLSAIALFPIVWLVEAALVGRAFGLGWGLLTGLIAPASGYSALRFSERGERLGEELRAYLLLRTRNRVREELRRRRAAVLDGLQALVTLDREGEV